MYVRKDVRGGEGVSESHTSAGMTSALQFGMFGRILLKSYIDGKGKAEIVEIVQVAVVAEYRKLFVRKVSSRPDPTLSIAS